MDLITEAEKKGKERISEKVAEVGGDLLDEAAVKMGRPDVASPRFLSALERNKEIAEKINEDIGAFESFRIAMGRGMGAPFRALGLVDQEPEHVKEGFRGLEEKHPRATLAGEVIGQAAPFAVASTPIGAIASTGGRIAAGAGLGALEGGLIAKDEGGTAGEIAVGAGVGSVLAGSLEVLLPRLGRVARKFITQKTGRRPRGSLITPDGQPTPELQQALEETGTTFTQLRDEAVAELANQTDAVTPADAARLARFRSQGIPATTGNITQDFSQQAAEERLVARVGDEASEGLRQTRLAQSEALTSRFDELIESLGVPNQTGDSIKAALTGRKNLLRAEKNALYQKVADAAPEVSNVPLFTQGIGDALPKPQELKRLSRLSGNQIDALRSLLVEFGIDQSDDAVKAFDGEITPLSLGNFEDFRMALNQIDRADTTGAASVAIGPIREALDAEAELVDSAMKAAGINVDDTILSTLKQARERVRTLKTEFSPQAITGRLIGTKRDGETPIIEASRVAPKLLDGTVEDLRRTLSSLHKAGTNGKKAIGNLQASVILRALDDGLKAPSRKTGGIQTVGGNQIAKSLSKIGDEKLDLLFRSNKPALDQLRGLVQTGLDMTATADAKPKGSASVMLDIVNRFKNVPGIAHIREIGEFLLNAGADERAVYRALRANPRMLETATFIDRDFPQLASALGIAGIAQIELEDEDDG